MWTLLKCMLDSFILLIPDGHDYKCGISKRNQINPQDGDQYLIQGFIKHTGQVTDNSKIKQCIKKLRNCHRPKFSYPYISLLPDSVNF